MKNTLLIFTLLATLLLSGCNDTPNTDESQRVQTEKMSAEANRQVGMPGIVNFQERKLMKRIYELRDQEKLLTYTYVVDVNGNLHFLCRSMGYGLPYSTQFTNPERILRGAGNAYLGNLPQPEPNGLFMPESAEGTWIMMVDDSGETHPIYVEPRIIVSPVRLDIK